MPLLVTVGAAACLRLYRQWQQKDLDNSRLTQENYQAELQLLKAQIHPHFLFNTLNNLYALTLKQSEQAPAVVDRLTGLLQFVVEQGRATFVTLPEEVALLRNYLALEQLRYGPRLHLEFSRRRLARDRLALRRCCCCPWSKTRSSTARPSRWARPPSRLCWPPAPAAFTCLITNTKNAASAAGTGSVGIGLRNVRKRLALLYPQRHEFVTEAHDHSFTVRLALQLLESPPGPGAGAVPGPPRRPAK
jgi:LytS/YehU family sensor histidine kinase